MLGEAYYRGDVPLCPTISGAYNINIALYQWYEPSSHGWSGAFFSPVKLLFSPQSPSHPRCKGRGIQLYLWSYVKTAIVSIWGGGYFWGYANILFVLKVSSINFMNISMDPAYSNYCWVVFMVIFYSPLSFYIYSSEFFCKK